MVRVAPINLAYNPRTLWFDPGDIDFSKGDAVVVETARGVEFGHAASDAIEVEESEIKALKSPLKPVLRLATDEDLENAREMEQKSREALPVFKKMAAESNADMHPVSVEYLLEGDKAVFYFEAEERVDFRDLVRKLAAQFHVRIDMRQIGVRDEARMVGGLGHCGQELCCKRLGADFNPVSIRMAKEQDLSLNPQKISGLCGRLMCCLRYEYEAYKDFKSRAPKQGATVSTPQGPGKVVDLDVPREVVSVRIGDEKPVRVPLTYFDEPKEGARPSSIGEEAWAQACASGQAALKGDPVTFLTSQFTGSDKLAEAGSVHRVHPGKSQRSKGSSDSQAAKKRRSRSEKSSTQAQGSTAPETTHRSRRRRSTRISGDTAVVEDARKSGAAAEEAPASRESSQKRRARGGSKGASGAKGAGESTAQKNSSRGRGSQRKKQDRTAGQARKGSGEGQSKTSSSQGSRKQGPRPGQRSSGLAHREGGQAPQTQQHASKPKASGERSGESAAPRRRRRSRKPRGGASGSPASSDSGNGNA